VFKLKIGESAGACQGTHVSHALQGANPRIPHKNNIPLFGGPKKSTGGVSRGLVLYSLGKFSRGWGGQFEMSGM
jgi:hypothetical protein